MNDDVLALLQETSERTVVEPKCDLAVLVAAARRQLQIERRIADLEAELESEKKQLIQLSQQTIPDYFDGLGQVTSFVIEFDERQWSISIEPMLHVGVTKENTPAFCAWLRKNNLDEIIKNEVSLSFGKGQETDAAELVQLLSAKGYSFNRKEGVHPQTLKAWAKRRLKETKPLPPTDILSIHEIKTSSVKPK